MDSVRQFPRRKLWDGWDTRRVSPTVVAALAHRADASRRPHNRCEAILIFLLFADWLFFLRFSF